ncbi:MAG: class I SAM-dependent methyltransferase [Clostridiales bacterium]|nr:class I SAM-dependent methyltransferase [Candidatus Blautia equi]
MKKHNPFETGAAEYDSWFQENAAIFQSELSAIRACFLSDKKTLEIGIGTGAFALPLGIKEGLEPSEDMAAICEAKGIHVERGEAEELPYESGSYEQIAMITVDCFLNDIDQALEEIRRVLTPDGNFIMAFLDRETPLGQIYEAGKEDDPIYRYATLRSSEEILTLLQKHHFTITGICQTVTELVNKEQPVLKGYGKGVFVAVQAKKQ